MVRISRRRLTTLADRLHPQGPPIGRLLFLIPDLWPEADHATFEAPRDQEELESLIVRRTGVPPSFDLRPFWAVTVPASEEMLAMTDGEKAEFLARHESRPRTAGAWSRAEPCD